MSESLEKTDNICTTSRDASSIRPLNPELAEVANTQCKESEVDVKAAIQELREWILRQPNLKSRTHDQFLLAFLRFCHFDQEDARKRIMYFYNYKSTAGDLLKSRKIDDKLLSISRSGIFVTLPNPIGPGGPRIHFTRMGKIDTSQFNVRDLFRFHVFRSEVEINTDDNWIISGVVEIIDFSKIPFSFLRQFQVALFKKMSAFLEWGMPTNLMATHIYNASKEAQIILHLVRAVMKQKDLLHIHSNLESLQKAIGKEYLPIELGGTNSTLDGAMQIFESQLMCYKDYFDEEEEYGVTDAKPIDEEDKSETKTTPSDGSFRRLDID